MAKKVLVVDDELDMRTFITTLLETNGFKPLTAQDGFQGLEVARKRQAGSHYPGHHDAQRERD